MHLFEKEMFAPLNNPALFNVVEVEMVVILWLGIMILISVNINRDVMAKSTFINFLMSRLCR